MARLGRSRPNRPIIRRNKIRIDRDVALPAFELADEFPALTVVVPDAHALLPAFELADEFPDATISFDVTAQLPAFELADEFPALTVEVPILPGDAMDGLPGQIEWNGFLLGRGTRYRWLNLTGWREMPPLETGNVQRATGDGSHEGQPTLRERIVNFSLLIAVPRDEIGQAIEDLEDVTGVAISTDPGFLVINDLGTPYLAFGKVSARNPGGVGKRMAQGFADSYVLQWTCGDPRRYSLERFGVVIPKDAPTAVLNAGNRNTQPALRIPGPCKNPVITNQRNERVISFRLELAGGERLDVDCRALTAVVGDQNVMDTLGGTVAVSDWVLDPGSNPILFEAESGGEAGCTIFWRHARA